jgi:choline-sulfatase
MTGDTLVIFTSDHGDNLGSHGLWNKQYMIEEAIRVPFIVSQPGAVPARVVAGQVASLLDLAPTILGYPSHPADHIEDAPHQFFDLRTDPFESDNLAPTDRQVPLAAELRERLVRWHHETPYKV